MRFVFWREAYDRQPSVRGRVWTSAWRRWLAELCLPPTLVMSREVCRIAADLIGVDHLTIGYGFDSSQKHPIPHIVSTQPPEYWADYHKSRIYELSPTPAAVLDGAARTLLLSSLETGSRAHAFLDRWNVAQLTVLPLASPDKAGVILSYSSREIPSPYLALQLNFLGSAVMLAAGPLLRGEHTRRETLTDDEISVLKWVAAGKSNTDIAVILQKSRRSVDNSVVRILRKLGVSTRVQAAAWFLAATS